MATKIKGLQLWCRKMTEGYPHVDISNFTTAWRDGMAFCAIIHRFRPDLIDYDSLSPENVFENNKLAFEVGESELNIPAFLEADDMARLKVPDKLSVITYVSQYYNYLNNLPQLGGPGVKGAVKKGHVAGTKRPPDTTKTSSEPSTKKTVSAKEDAKNIANTQPNTTSSPRKGTVGDKCGICQNKVYLLERHIEGGKLYHRSCFRHSDLSPTNKVFTKSPFMSPSLNNEKAVVVADKPSKVYGISDKSQTPSNDIHEKHNNNIANSNKKGSESSVLANLKSGLKKVDGGSSAGGMVGSKHSIQVDKDKDDEAKKAKVQPRNLFGAGGGLGKENQNSEKRVGHESVYPLSGKEAKKLEKRRQEILASESSTPVNKGAKRGMPLVFQSKDKSEASLSSISSSPSTQSTTNKLSVGSGDNVNANSSSKTPVPVLKSESKDTKSKPSASSDVSEGSKLNTIQSLQSKFSGQSQPSSNKVESAASTGMKSSSATASNQPVARPRVTGSKIASSPFIDGDNSTTGKSGNNSGPSASANEPISLRTKNDSQSVNAPVAIPRKSLVENVNSKKVITSDKDKKTSNLSHSHLTTESSSSEDNCTPRSARSKFSTTSSSSSTASTPPPALPLTPPPSLSQSKPPSLPQSKPPPLPTSPPPNVPTSRNHHSSVVNNKTKLSSLSSSSSSSSSPSTSSTTTTAKISLKPVSPTPTQQPPTQNLVTSSDKKEDGAVLSGLLASLAGVRGRSASTPNPVIPAPQQQPLATTKVNKVQITGATTPKTTNKLTITAVSTVATPTITPSTPSSTVLSNRKHSEPAVKLCDVKVHVQHEDKDKKSESSSLPFASKKSIPISNTTSISSSSAHKESSNSDSNEVKNVLNSLKPVSTTNISTPSKNYTASSIQSSDKIKDIQKTNNTKSENKVGNLVKNYLSKSKEDLSHSGYTGESTRSKVEDSSKKPSKPLRAKDIGIKDQLSSNSNISQRGEDSKGAVGDQSKYKNNDTTLSPRNDVKLKKVELPTEFEQDSSNISKSASHLKTEEGDQKNKNDAVSDVPQWKKDIEERKKKLRDDIIRSETPSKWSERQDKEKSQPGKGTAPKENVSDLSVKSEKVSSVGKDVVTSSKEDNSSKLNWQREAERRMAAFALFDNEDESKSAGGSDAKVEDKITEMNNEQKKRNTEAKSSKLKDGMELTKHNNKIGLKTVDIDIDINGDSSKNRKELSKPQSINNNNNLPLRVDLKKTSEISNPQQTLEMKDDKIIKKNEGDEKQHVKDADTSRKQPSPKVSPKVKRKITVLGSNKQKANHQPTVSPPVTPVISEKKKISVIGRFDFDSSTPSDYESSISHSTEQIRIGDQSPIPSSPTPPPRTKSQRNKPASPKQISAIELQQQLMEIDNRLTDLELRGRDLEDSIRNASSQEGSSVGASSNSDEFDDDDDRLMMEWFQLVSEKNELVRKEADLVYLSREQDLEDEQEQIDHQLRYLLSKDDLIKSPQEREEEAYLLQRKVDIVNQRSSIIDSMDEDRLRYEEEDRGIEYVLKSKGLWKDDDGSFLVEQGRSVANSTFYA